MKKIELADFRKNIAAHLDDIVIGGQEVALYHGKKKLAVILPYAERARESLTSTTTNGWTPANADYNPIRQPNPSRSLHEANGASSQVAPINPNPLSSPPNSRELERPAPRPHPRAMPGGSATVLRSPAIAERDSFEQSRYDIETSRALREAKSAQATFGATQPDFGVPMSFSNILDSELTPQPVSELRFTEPDFVPSPGKYPPVLVYFNRRIRFEDNRVVWDATIDVPSRELTEPFGTGATQAEALGMLIFKCPARFNLKNDFAQLAENPAQ